MVRSNLWFEVTNYLITNMADHKVVLSCLNIIKNQFKDAKDTKELLLAFKNFFILVEMRIKYYQSRVT